MSAARLTGRYMLDAKISLRRIKSCGSSTAWEKKKEKRRNQNSQEEEMQNWRHLVCQSGKSPYRGPELKKSKEKGGYKP